MPSWLLDATQIRFSTISIIALQETESKPRGELLIPQLWQQLTTFPQPTARRNLVVVLQTPSKLTIDVAAPVSDMATGPTLSASPCTMT